MRCVDCRWFNRENEFCMKDGGSVFGATIDDECEYADNMTVFDRLTTSPEVLAEKLVYWEHDDWGSGWTSNLIDEVYNTEAEALAATVAKLKEVAE